jgi:hypothetical protein
MSDASFATITTISAEKERNRKRKIKECRVQVARKGQEVEKKEG